MKNTRLLVPVLLIAALAGSSMLSAQAVVTQNKGSHRFGVGANYWVSLSDVKVPHLDCPRVDRAG